MELNALLTGRHVRLTAICPDDYPVMAAWFQDSHFLRLFDSVAAYPKSPEQVATWIESLLREPSNYIFAVRTIRDGTLTGLAGLDGVSGRNRCCHLMIGIGPHAQKRGYGRETLRLLLEYAFNELNLHSVHLTVFAYNRTAIRLYEEIGFRRQGAYRDFVFRDGAYHDMLIMGILRQEWQSPPEKP